MNPMDGLDEPLLDDDDTKRRRWTKREDEKLRAGGDVAEAVALQKALILWCAEGLHPKLAPFLRGKAKGEVALELAFCDVAVVSDEEREKELAAGEAAPTERTRHASGYGCSRAAQWLLYHRLPDPQLSPVAITPTTGWRIRTLCRKARWPPRSNERVSSV